MANNNSNEPTLWETVGVDIDSLNETMTDLSVDMTKNSRTYLEVYESIRDNLSYKELVAIATLFAVDSTKQSLRRHMCRHNKGLI